MPVAPLFHTPENESDLLRFAWLNIAHHRSVSDWISANRGIAVEKFAIYPLPSGVGLGTWLANHQSWHSQIDTILGVRSNNLLNIDLQNMDALRAWVFLHATEHQAWESVTGVG